MGCEGWVIDQIFRYVDIDKTTDPECVLDPYGFRWVCKYVDGFTLV